MTEPKTLFELKTQLDKLEENHQRAIRRINRQHLWGNVLLGSLVLVLVVVEFWRALR